MYKKVRLKRQQWARSANRGEVTFYNVKTKEIKVVKDHYSNYQLERILGIKSCNNIRKVLVGQRLSCQNWTLLKYKNIIGTNSVDIDEELAAEVLLEFIDTLHGYKFSLNNLIWSINSVEGFKDIFLEKGQIAEVLKAKGFKLLKWRNLYKSSDYPPGVLLKRSKMESTFRDYLVNNNISL